jgi:hypothetical protein
MSNRSRFGDGESLVLVEVGSVGEDCPGVAGQLVGEGGVALPQEFHHHERLLELRIDPALDLLLVLPPVALARQLLQLQTRVLPVRTEVSILALS